MYHISMMIDLSCQKDGTTLSEGCATFPENWYYFVSMGLLCQKGGTALSEGWYKLNSCLLDVQEWML